MGLSELTDHLAREAATQLCSSQEHGLLFCIHWSFTSQRSTPPARVAALNLWEATLKLAGHQPETRCPSPIAVHPARDAHWFYRTKQRWRDRDARVSGPAQISCDTDDALPISSGQLAQTASTSHDSNLNVSTDNAILHSAAFRNASVSFPSP